MVLATSRFDAHTIIAYYAQLPHISIIRTAPYISPTSLPHTRSYKSCHTSNDNPIYHVQSDPTHARVHHGTGAYVLDLHVE
jgi:hypothetical protein